MQKIYFMKEHMVKKYKSLLLLCCALMSLTLLSGCASQVKRGDLAAYSETSLMLDNGSYKVPGVLVVPQQGEGKPLPVIVMLHGTASQKNEVGNLYQRLAVYLASKGYASLRIDFAGTGDSPVDYRFYNLTSATTDAATALDFLAADDRFDTGRMGLIGFSQGGLIAQLVAEKDSRIKALVTWSSVGGDGVDIFSAFFDEYYAEAKANGFAVVHFPWRSEPLNFGLQWFEEIQRNTSLSDLHSYRGKLLAIAGAEDPLVPYQSSLKIMQAAGSISAAFHLVKGAGHMYNVLGAPDENGLAGDQTIAEGVLSTTTAWFASAL